MKGSLNSEYFSELLEVNVLAKQYCEIAEQLYFRAINYEKNKMALQGVVHYRVLDQTMVIYVQIKTGIKLSVSMPLPEECLNRWGISQEAVYKDVMKNTMRLNPASFFAMDKVLATKTPDGVPQLSVLTSKTGVNGAICMWYPGELDKCSEIIGGDFYIIPSSIEEVLIFPASKNEDEDTLKEMVYSTNRDGQVINQNQILSDHVYYYCRASKTLAII